MQRLTAFAVTAAALALCGLGGCVTAPDNGSDKIQTTADADHSGVKGVAEAPFRDLNMLRTKIPDVLLKAMADPYEWPGNGRCVDLIARLTPLNPALGEDLDVVS